jgi:L-aminopeptidase/D-esterase-like protein
VITDVAGVRVGHWTHPTARTGCTVVLLPDGTVGSGEIRGGAPATREFALLEPIRSVARLDAVVLTGGSAFGLAAADGVVRRLESAGVGFETSAGVVPIVVALGLYDLAEGDASVRPGPDDGAAAYDSATDGTVPVGRLGAAAGATVDGWLGVERRRPGGIGTASVIEGDLCVAALVAVNSVGSVDDGSGSDAPDLAAFRQVLAARLGATAGLAPGVASGEQTTIGVIATNARLDKLDCRKVAEGGHDGLARAVFPPHTSADGDALVAAATGQVDAPVDLVRTAAVMAVERAVRQVGQ